ncbi:MAG: anti-sigma factor, partial [Acidobacteriota bacterium]
ARLLVPKEEPSVQVWQRIQQQLRQEGLIQAPAPFPFSPAARVRIGWFPRLQMGMAYAAMFLMGLGVVYLYSVGTIPGFFQEPPITVATVLTAPVEQSPSESDEPILQLIEKAPQEKRATYVMNLNQVNSSIHQWNTFLAEHPGDGFAREQLLNTYQQKERLWNTLLNWEEF